MAFKRTFIIVNLLLIFIGIILILSVHATLTGSVVGKGIDAHRTTFYGIVLVAVGIAMLLLYERLALPSE